jgi:hypothetical protein
MSADLTEQTFLSSFCVDRFAGLRAILDGLLVSDLGSYTKEELVKLVKDRSDGKLEHLVPPFLVAHSVSVGGQRRTLASFLAQPVAAEPQQKKARAEVSPLKSHFGQSVVEMTVAGVLSYLIGFQREAKLRQPDVIHGEDELTLKLCGREAAVQVMVGAFETRRKSLLLDPEPKDRTLFPMVVCSGMKGLGKTRMLEEWPKLFEVAGVPGPHLGVLLSYGNGHAPQPFENRMPIQAAFGWRMLHRLFVEGNHKTVVEDNCEVELAKHWFDREFLPSNADELLLDVALNVLRAGAERFGIVAAGDTLSLFVGVDEYQAVPCGGDFDASDTDQHRARTRTFLWQLISALDGCRKLRGLHVYPGFAGTQWGPLSIAGSSVPETKRVPLTLLSPQAIEDVVHSSVELQSRLVSPDFRRKLFFLGGIPRPSVKFALGESFESVWETYVKEKWTTGKDGLSPTELLRLVAFSVSGVRVQPAEGSLIKSHTWFRLFEEGVCVPLDDGQLGIPYSVFHLAAKIDPDTVSDLAAKCLIQNLWYLRDHVDSVLYDNEPWQLWEKFGACFFAMRVNARVLLGFQEIVFSKLCGGAVTNGSNHVVKLFPMEVHAIEEALSVELPAIVTEKKDHRKLNWVTGDKGICYCIINGTGGRGVDVFCALPLVSPKGAMLLYLDQRKVEARALGERTAGNLLSKALIVPKCLPPQTSTVRGLFSVLSSFNQAPGTLPLDTFVLSYRQHGAFHGTLVSHPACRSFVDVNYDNISTLRLLKSVAVLAEAVVEKRRVSKFTSVVEFADFCKSLGRMLSEEDSARVAAYADLDV